MRYRLFGAGLLAAVLLVAACQEKSEPDPEINFTGDSVALASSGKEFTVAGGEFGLTFKSTAAWTAGAEEKGGTPAAWIEIYPSSGTADDTEVKVIVTPNTTIQPRSAVVSVRSGKVSVSMTVRQAAKAKVEPTAIAFEDDAKVVFVGKTLQLEATVTPADADILSEFVWTSSDETVAKVSRKGVVKGLVPGTADITVTLGALSAVCHVTVRDFVNLKSIELNKTELELDKDETFTLVPTIVPETADEVTFVWESSNRSVATVRDGVVTAVASGDAVITVSSGGVSATCKVHVKRHATSVSVTPDKVSVERGRTVTLAATVKPLNADVKTVTWSVEDESIATVDAETGVVTGVALGKTTVTATAESGIFGTCEVTVVERTGSGGEDMDNPVDVNPW